MWGSANVIRQGFERLRKTANDAAGPAKPQETAQSNHQGNPEVSATVERRLDHGLSQRDDMDDFDWTALFPFVSQHTGGIANSLLTDREQGAATRGFPSPENALFHETLLNQFEDLFEPFVDYRLDFMVPG